MMSSSWSFRVLPSQALGLGPGHISKQPRPDSTPLGFLGTLTEGLPGASGTRGTGGIPTLSRSLKEGQRQPDGEGREKYPSEWKCQCQVPEAGGKAGHPWAVLNGKGRSEMSWGNG